MLQGVFAGLMLAILIPAACSRIPDPSQAYGVALSIVPGDRATGTPNDAGWVTVTLANVANKDLAVAYTPQMTRLRFQVEDTAGHIVASRPYPWGGGTVRTSSYFPAGRTAAVALRLVDWNDIRQPGTYRVRAIYRVAILGNVGREVELISNEISITIPRDTLPAGQSPKRPKGAR